ncbi:L-idonate 5-dehydrogenase [Goodfellowiella coeruleoviolacea]|uniref:L-idonate 5-dehydrogenase n=1 Tax=Goodfellowiella coeruleoviolacea TaxID=334858 RepID=A0AAE3G8D9_9PSEU|nr:L-idonate 5-dehydrogenase [Goodfellowiella coeruleoviolacea]MCP2163606.1 L-idonate 5-dehydrogenase [Goodfellowiella coeruleoviolacea]
MQAVVIHGARDLRLDDIERPAPGPDDVLVAVEYGGICGSDLHYWQHGATGTSILREPMVLGHEVAGVVAAVGSGITDVHTGQPVTLHPATTCDHCPECRGGHPNLCADVSYFGSAARLPHSPGAFARYRVVPRAQVRPLPPGVSTRHGAVAEPLGVAVHAVRRAGSVRGRRVLVNGAGPIGCLVVAAAKALGAGEVHASDLTAASLGIAAAMGADHTVQVGTGQSLPAEVDVVFEASGAPAAVGACLTALRRGGTLVQVGNLPAGQVSVELAPLVSREITYVGSFRFVDEISDAVALIAEGLDVEPLLTHTFPVDQVETAFRTALDRSVASKVLLDFTSARA